MSSNPSEPKLSVVLPAWNERENLLTLVPALLSFPCVQEVLVVDDASTDGSDKLFRGDGLLAKERRVKFLSSAKRLGLAKSILVGIEQATQDWILIRDSDWNHDIQTLPLMLNLAEKQKADLVIASRRLASHGISRTNDLFSFALNQIAFRCFGQITDWTYGYFLVQKSVLGNLEKSKIFRGRGEYAVRLYRECRKQKITIAEVPTEVQARGAGRSTTQLLKHGLPYLSAFFP